MGTLGWLMFAVIGGTIWGGFLTFLVLGLRREAAKQRDSRQT